MSGHSQSMPAPSTERKSTLAGVAGRLPRMCAGVHLAGYAQIAASCPSPKRSGVAG
jgi:hypothetical protein